MYGGSVILIRKSFSRQGAFIYYRQITVEWVIPKPTLPYEGWGDKRDIDSDLL